MVVSIFWHYYVVLLTIIVSLNVSNNERIGFKMADYLRKA